MYTLLTSGHYQPKTLDDIPGCENFDIDIARGYVPDPIQISNGYRIQIQFINVTNTTWYSFSSFPAY
jgi:hypothetical protein